MAEHNVVNPQAVDVFVRKFITRTRPDAGKAWFQKKLRSFIINDGRYLTPLSSDDLALMPNLPDYARAAAGRGEALYDFEPSNGQTAAAIGDLTQRMNHVTDWFNALAMVAARPATSQVEIEDKTLATRWLEKLAKIPVAEITEIADQWFSHMGTRIKAEKDGVEIVMTWPDGYYAVRYTDLNTMKTDGRELQNCLQNGYYWADVKSGRGGVYAIRKPTDEAVVGIRVLRGVLQECKGKNNKPVRAGYLPYVVDFLGKMGWDLGDAHDLKAAGIEVHDGKIGKFEDVADLVYDKNGLRIWQTKGRFLARTATMVVDGRIISNTIFDVTSSRTDGEPDADEDPDGIHFEALDLTNADILRILNIIKLPPAGSLAMTLEKIGVFFYDGRYGEAREIGKPLFHIGEYQSYEVSVNRPNSTPYELALIYTGDRQVGRFVVNGGKLADYRLAQWDKEDAETLIAMLNAMKFPPAHVDVENKLAQDFDIYYDKAHYGTLADTSKPDITVGRITLARLGKRRMWIVQDAERDVQQRFWFIGKKLECSTGQLNKPDQAYAQAVRELALKYKATSVEYASEFGILNTKQGIVADFASLLSTASATPDAAYGGSHAYHEKNDTAGALVHLTTSNYKNLSVDDQRKLYTTFKAKDGGILWHIQHSSKVYDIEVPDIFIRLPTANPYFVARDVITDKSLIAAVAKDSLASIKAAGDLINSHDYGRFSIRSSPAKISRKVGEALNLLSRMADARNAKTEDAMRERHRNPDKYATDLSSRFAAMNAFNKKSY